MKSTLAFPLKDSFFWKRWQRQRERETYLERSLTYWFTAQMVPTQPDWDHVETKSQGLHPGLPKAWQKPSYLEHLLFPRHMSRQLGQLVLEVAPDTGCQCCEQRLNPLQHNASLCWNSAILATPCPLHVVLVSCSQVQCKSLVSWAALWYRHILQYYLMILLWTSGWRTHC